MKKYLRTGLLSLTVMATSAMAAEFPTHPIRMLAGFTAGGGSDIAARTVAQKLSESLGQSVVVDNRTGATGAIAAEMLAKAPPDGYTLMMLAVAQLVATAFDDKMPFDVVPRLCGSEPGVAQSLRDGGVTQFARAHGARIHRSRQSATGQAQYGSTGIGGSNHIVTEVFNVTAGIKLAHVPYKGPPQALADLAGNQVQLVFASITSGLPARAGG